MKTRCANCGYDSDFDFCPYCGNTGNNKSIYSNLKDVAIIKIDPDYSLSRFVTEIVLIERELITMGWRGLIIVDEGICGEGYEYVIRGFISDRDFERFKSKITDFLVSHPFINSFEFF